MQRLERLVAITETLRRSAPRSVSARMLADEFGVTTRTIERDLGALRSAGVPLYAEAGCNGGAVSVDPSVPLVIIDYEASSGGFKNMQRRLDA